MLPSGNDAAIVLAEYFGTKLEDESEKLEENEVDKKMWRK